MCRPSLLKVKVLVAQSCPTLCNLMDYSLPGSSVHGKNTGVGSHSLLQEIFPTQGSNPGLLHRRWILYHLSHQGSPQVALTHAIFKHSFYRSLRASLGAQLVKNLPTMWET